MWKHSRFHSRYDPLLTSASPIIFRDFLLLTVLFTLCCVNMAQLHPVSYINQAGAVHVAFVSANSRVPTQAATTIPRLELCASADLAISTHEIALTLKIPIANVFLYTDSRIVLGYLTNTTRRISVYVTRRVNVALKNFPASHCWKYIPTSLNPADIASRPQTTRSLMDSWFHRGPPFSWKKSFNEDVLAQELALDLPETKQELNVMKSSVEKSNSLIADILAISSSLYKALTLAYPIVSFAMYTVDCVQQRNGISLAPRILSLAIGWSRCVWPLRDY